MSLQHYVSTPYNHYRDDRVTNNNVAWFLPKGDCPLQLSIVFNKLDWWWVYRTKIPPYTTISMMSFCFQLCDQDQCDGIFHGFHSDPACVFNKFDAGWNCASLLELYMPHPTIGDHARCSLNLGTPYTGCLIPRHRPHHTHCAKRIAKPLLGSMVISQAALKWLQFEVHSPIRTTIWCFAPAYKPVSNILLQWILFPHIVDCWIANNFNNF